MNFKFARLALPLGLAVALGHVFIPLGCGRAREEAVYAPTRSAPERPTLPDEMAERLKNCIIQGAARLTSNSYAILLNVKASYDGEVSSAAVRDSILGDQAIEACMVDALQSLALPASIKSMRPSLPISERAMSPGSRTFVGNALVLGGVIVELLPIVIVAAGITVVVGVTITLAGEATTSRPKPDLDKDEECYEKCKHLLPSPSGDLQASEYRKCYRECKGTL